MSYAFRSPSCDQRVSVVGVVARCHTLPHRRLAYRPFQQLHRRPRPSLTLAVGLAAILVVTGTARAQINGTTPALMGEPSFHVYSVPGIIAGGLGLDTFFGCTNTTGLSIRVGVEVFGPVGGAAANDPSASSLDIPPGGTRIFGTSAAIGISVDSNLGGFFSKGSARILATKSKGIICSAFLADINNAPPTSIADLTIVAKTKQRGD